MQLITTLQYVLPLYFLPLLLVKETWSCPSTLFTKASKKDPTAALILGKSLNPEQSENSAELVHFGQSCPKVKINVPLEKCFMYKPFVVNVRSQIIICGAYSTSECGAAVLDDEITDETEPSSCLLWQMGDEGFKPLDPITSKLPETLPKGTNNFDLIYKPKTTLFYRPWGTSNFWKAKLNKNNDLFWSRISKAPLALDASCMILYRGHVYLIGGRWKDASGQIHISSSVFRFVDEKGVGWQIMQDLPLALYGHQCTQDPELGILLVGGTTADGRLSPNVYSWSGVYHAPWTKWITPVSEHHGMNLFDVAVLRDAQGDKKLLLAEQPSGSQPNPVYVSMYKIGDQKEIDPAPGWLMTQSRSNITVITIPASWVNCD